MELLTITVGTDMLGNPSLDCIYGRDVPSQPYPSPTTDLLLKLAALSVVWAGDPEPETADETEVLLVLPTLLRRLADQVQTMINKDRKLRNEQLALFS